MSVHVDATFYAHVEPKFSSNGERVWSSKVVAVTQSKPNKPRGGTVLVKLTIRIPEAAFLPLRPEAIVVIPEDMTAPYPVEVTAEDPNE